MPEEGRHLSAPWSRLNIYRGWISQASQSKPAYSGHLLFLGVPRCHQLRRGKVTTSSVGHSCCQLRIKEHFGQKVAFSTTKCAVLGKRTDEIFLPVSCSHQKTYIYLFISCQIHHLGIMSTNLVSS